MHKRTHRHTDAAKTIPAWSIAGAQVINGWTVIITPITGKPTPEALKYGTCQGQEVSV